MHVNLFKFLLGTIKNSPDKRLDMLVDFSLAAPSALDPEQLTDALVLLRRFGWDARKAARYVNDAILKGFDDAMLEKGDDPFGPDIPPGPSS